MAERLRWFNVLGPNAWCATGCGWHANGDNGRGRETIRAGRDHNRETGHSVHFERGEAAILDATQAVLLEREEPSR